MKKTVGIVVQARLGSTRLPQKVLLELWDGKSVIESIVERLQSITPSIPVVVATTDSNSDLKLVEFLHSRSISVFAGSENDVLRRFVDCSKQYGFDAVVRVCSDNPFLQINTVKALVDMQSDDCYRSYSVGQLPSILTHYGFWAEWVTTNALIRADKDLAPDALERQHVTAHLYHNQNQFRCRFVQADTQLLAGLPVRLTLDTSSDFEVTKAILEETNGGALRYSISELCSLVARRVDLQEKMRINIQENSK